MNRIQKALLPLSCCVLLCDGLLAQTESPHLNLVVVEGEGAINRPGSRAAHDAVVRVEDDMHHPVEGTTVVFTLPASGASATFSSGSKRLTVTTDHEGLAVAKGLRTNDVTGKLGIDVNASYRGESAHALITEFNLDPSGAHHGGGGSSGKSSGKLVVILTLVAGAAAGGAFFALHRSSSSSPSQPTVTLTPGSTTVGAP